ncbi:hypothetical protein L083_5486 [Actinoplanes sp. N902-109]|nr:hypothetical protein L083_5486 [Actinoplanes sp. N902-109]
MGWAPGRTGGYVAVTHSGMTPARLSAEESPPPHLTPPGRSAARLLTPRQRNDQLPMEGAFHAHHHDLKKCIAAASRSMTTMASRLGSARVAWPVRRVDAGV